MLEVGIVTNNPTPVLEVSDLSREFAVSKGPFSRGTRSLKAVQDLNFTVGKGETLAIVGESGCGKTTTTRMLLGLDKPTHGKVLVNGKDIFALNRAGRKDFRSSVQAVFQDPWSSLNPRMRVRDIVAEPLIAKGKISRSEVDDRVERVLVDVGLRAEQARNFPHEFSGGQRQRIAIASALICDPQLIVLDEPVSALDVSIRSQIMNLFKDIQEKYGVSYILVAHDLATTRYLANNIAVMYLGRIVEQGPSEAVFGAPQHPYTRALFSAALPSHPDAVHDEIELEGDLPSPLDPPSGCPFHPRCPEAKLEICHLERPVLRESIPQVVAACHLLQGPAMGQ
jgi:peptide/nickel transport system ATP-binding protein/oligopeptide transport system ATP-binding protein